MFFFDMLLSLYLQLALGVGEEVALGLIAVGGLAVAGGGWWLAHRIVDDLVNAPASGPSLQTSPRKRMAGLSDAGLARHLAGHPNDALALREQIRRSRSSVPPGELATRIEALLAMKPRLDLDDLAMLHHQLADLYCGPLNLRTRAVQVLDAFAHAHPESREAQFMRERIAQIGKFDAD